MNAGVTFCAKLRIPSDRTVYQGERAGGTGIHAQPAMIAEVDGIGIVTVQAVQIASLQKDDSPVTRTIYKAMRKKVVDPTAAGFCLIGGLSQSYG